MNYQQMQERVSEILQEEIEEAKMGLSYDNHYKMIATTKQLMEEIDYVSIRTTKLIEAVDNLRNVSSPQYAIEVMEGIIENYRAFIIENGLKNN